MSEPRKNAEKTQPYSSIPPSSCETMGMTVEMARASKPMSVTVSTRPMVGRAIGRHRLSAGSAGWKVHPARMAGNGEVRHGRPSRDDGHPSRSAQPLQSTSAPGVHDPSSGTQALDRSPHARRSPRRSIQPDQGGPRTGDPSRRAGSRVRDRVRCRRGSGARNRSSCAAKTPPGGRPGSRRVRLRRRMMAAAMVDEFVGLPVDDRAGHGVAGRCGREDDR